jgi:hypothetical protein
MCNVCRSKLCSSTRWRSAGHSHRRNGPSAMWIKWETLFVCLQHSPGWFIYETAGGWVMGFQVLLHPNNKRVLRFYFTVYWIFKYAKKWVNFSSCFLFDVDGNGCITMPINHYHFMPVWHLGHINCRREVKTMCLHDYWINRMHQLRSLKTIVTRILRAKTLYLCHHVCLKQIQV